MRKAIVEYPCNQGQAEAVILRTAEHVKEYFDVIEEDAGRYLGKMIASKSPIDRWDHMITKTPEGGIMLASISACKIKGGNPIIEFDKHLNQRAQNIFWSVAVQGKIAIVNSVGGYFTVDDDSSIVREWDDTSAREFTHVINEGSKYINLENDDDLEARTREYLQPLDSKFSYITRLNQYSQDELTEVFEEFIRAGGQIVHVYTTGINVPQMYEYVDAAIDAGITEFVFEFCAGMTDEIEEVLEHIGLITGVPPIVLKK